MKKAYQDSEQGCRELLQDHMENPIDPDFFFPDPYVKDVWLVLDSKKKRAIIVYLADNGLENVGFEEVEFIGTNMHDYLGR